VSDDRNEVPENLDARADYIVARLGDATAETDAPPPDADVNATDAAVRHPATEATAEPTSAEPVEPPQSWPEEDKAAFRALPREAQAVIARREGERERLLSQRSQELAEKARSLDAERLRYIEQLDGLIDQVESDPVVAEGRRTDWARLEREDPAMFARRFPDFQNRMQALSDGAARRQAVIDEIERARFEREDALLRQKLPEWSDPGRRKQLVGEISTALKEAGLTNADLSALRDHRMVMFVVDALRYRKNQQARKELGTKRTVAAPRTERPGAANEPGGNPHLDALRRKALTGGTLDDRANYILAALEGDR
jgi:hypothetical protein